MNHLSNFFNVLTETASQCCPLSKIYHLSPARPGGEYRRPDCQYISGIRKVYVPPFVYFHNVWNRSKSLESTRHFDTYYDTKLFVFLHSASKWVNHLSSWLLHLRVFQISEPFLCVFFAFMVINSVGALKNKTHHILCCRLWWPCMYIPYTYMTAMCFLIH